MSLYSLQDLAQLTALSMRTIRYYIQIGLLDKPEGNTRAASYTQAHLAQLLNIVKWSEAGLALDKIRELLHGDIPDLPPRQAAIGSISVCSHIHIAHGISLVIDPQIAQLSPEQLRQLSKQIIEQYQQLQSTDNGV